jgi:alkanesulfonate monooxygenase SsuD/methylene tetrahydromethanopterin reductase-like flavin-dependent oxidoreductase (luciferase family)
MEFGVLYDFRNPPRWRRSPAELYRRTLDHAAEMEQLGFDVIWVTEHHFVEDGYLPSCLPMAAALATRTSRAVIGTAVLLLPLHDPLRVAEDAAVVDVISGGRLRLGLGLGYKLDEFEAFGVARSSRAARMEEGVGLIRRAWEDGPSSFAGRWYRHTEVDVTPKPVQRPGPSIWLAGRGDKPIDRAARIGDGLIATPGRDLYRSYIDALARYGRTGPVNLCTFEFTYPSADPVGDAARLGPHAVYRSANYGEWYGEAGDLPMDRVRLDQQRAGRGPSAERFFASPDAVVSRLKDGEAAGLSSVLWFGTLPGAPPGALTPNLELIARDVMPAFRRPGERGA